MTLNVPTLQTAAAAAGSHIPISTSNDLNQVQSNFADGKGHNLDFGLLDERMLESIFRRDTFVRVQSHHAL